jgi:hypothetical protein
MDGITSSGGGSSVDPSQYYLPPSTTEEGHGGKGHTESTTSGGSQTQGPDQTDPSGTEPKVNVHREGNQQDQGGSGGQSGQSGSGGSGGSSSGGSSDSGGSGGRQGQGSTQTDSQSMLENAHGKANVQGGVLLNSATGTQQLARTSDVMTQANVNVNAASYAAPPAGASPAQPALAQPANFNQAAVAKELQGNPWFTSTFLVAITKSLNAYVSSQSEIQVAELQEAIQDMKNTVTQAQQTGNLILAIAQKQAQMYMTMAVASLVSLAVGLAGAGAGGLGKYKAAMADRELKGLEHETPPEEKGPAISKENSVKGDLKIGDEGNATPPQNPDTKTPEETGGRSAEERKSNATNQQKEADQVVTEHDQESTTSSENSAEYEQEAAEAGAVSNKLKTDTEKNTNAKRNKNVQLEEGEFQSTKPTLADKASAQFTKLKEKLGLGNSTKDRNFIDEAPQDRPIKNDGSQSKDVSLSEEESQSKDVSLSEEESQSKDVSLSEEESQSKDVLLDPAERKEPPPTNTQSGTSTSKDPKTGTKETESKTPLSDDERFSKMQELRKSSAKWSALGSAGDGISMTNQSLNGMLDNFIQAIFLPQTGALQRAQTLSEARAKIIQSGMDYANQAFNNATGAVSSAFQELQKIQDTNSQANDMKG